MKIWEIIDTVKLSDEKWVYVEIQMESECVNEWKTILKDNDRNYKIWWRYSKQRWFVGDFKIFNSYI